MDGKNILADITNRLKHISGISAIVLGGSRAKGTHISNSDIDIGLYYESAKDLDIEGLQKIAREIDDGHRENIMTEVNEWGNWVNGGGWLKVQNVAVDLLYRDLNLVSRTIDACLDGNITIDYYPGHPHGFVNSIYLGEIASCKILWESKNIITGLKERTSPFSGKFKKATIQKFLWEASFSLEAAKKAVAREDIAYVAGCFFRSVSCLNQVIFAINERYCTNEKGAVEFISSFEVKPPHYKERVNDIFEMIAPNQAQLTEAIHRLKKIIEETDELCMNANV
ncbi:nucleotidyltransferase domain-containing protein [Bacillus sp. FJAT-27245]|uniref:nucleotidyltransferase domain-containing protein n=1 Tax=Bacillus sp. FJAT-27245 TaxID=1684144 RepID=UPI0006A759AB|nr:nucleotidyltransferase domain-containing protein [Bacillus sp. FJAT-27245]